MAMALRQIACFLPLFAASIATVRSVAKGLRIYWTLHKEDVLILNEDEFTVSDKKFAAVFDQNIDFVERVADSAISEIRRLRLRGWRLNIPTLIECLVEDVFVPDQLGQVLNLILLICRGAEDAVARCHVMLDR